MVAWSCLIAIMVAHGALAADKALVDSFLAASKAGQCIESVTFRMIRDSGPDNAGQIVSAAVAAQSKDEQQQRVLGCEGDIAAQAITAGADPSVVLDATAAGLK